MERKLDDLDSTDGFCMDISDKMQVVDREEVKNKVFKFDSTDDIYDIISYFLEQKCNDQPFYIVDLGEVQKRYLNLVKCLPRFQAYYAIKSNPDPMILHVLAKLGCGFDCASKDEIILAKSTGSNKLLYANPCKDNDSLQFARSQDVDLLTFDSECELDKIKLFHSDAACILRIVVDDSGSDCKFSEKFGCELEEAEKLLDMAKISKLNIVGVSFHIGSNCRVSGAFTRAIADARKIFAMAHKKGFKLNILDCGGGFSALEDAKPTFEELASEINDAIDFHFADIPDMKYVVEPGRLLSQTSHCLVCCIIGIKHRIDPETKEHLYFYTINESKYGSFNCIVFDHATPQILPYNERTSQTYTSVIYGVTCDGIDKIACNIMLPKLCVGDRLFVQNFGSYTRASSSSFNGFKTSLTHYIIKS